MILKTRPDEDGLERVIEKLGQQGVEPKDLDISKGTSSYIIGIRGDTSGINEGAFSGMPEIEDVIRMTVKWKLLSREYHPEDTVVKVGDIEVGRGLTIMSGPCAIESYEQLLKTARAVRSAGAHMLRGGAYKPRTSRVDFQGLGEDGLQMLKKVKDELGLPVVTEITDKENIPLFQKYDIDVYQVGARNCQNFPLLKALAGIDRPVLLKRGDHISVDEFLNAADYVYSGNGENSGNKKVMLCERGDKTADPAYRNVFNINNIPNLRQMTHLPVIADPSHSTGERRLVLPVACAAVAAGAHGVIIEVHIDPPNALCDGKQSIYAKDAKEMARQLKTVYAAVHPR
ncbi:3-deoxy-7-phosphoheptulonate synthase [Candidatus Woesearchaeota archaeon]|nr:3-deoxy-7-phosphoheptulonate synthase [Candidatus Woesearchaeota archaeon]